MTHDGMIQHPESNVRGHIIKPSALIELAKALAAKHVGGHVTDFEDSLYADQAGLDYQGFQTFKHNLVCDWMAVLPDEDANALWEALYWPALPANDSETTETPF